MGISYLVKINYDPTMDVYFINGARTEVNEQKSLVDPLASLKRFFNLQGQQFTNLKQLLEILNSLEMQYIIQNRRKADIMVN